MANAITYKWACEICGLVLEFFNPLGVKASVNDKLEFNWIHRRCPICQTTNRFIVI